MKGRPKTLAEVASQTENAESLSYLMREFLDEFYADIGAWRLEECPVSLTETLGDDRLADTYLAAVADHLARQFGLKAGPWISDPARRIRKPWFAMKSHGGRMMLLIESPPAFRERNIFVSANALHRA